MDVGALLGWGIDLVGEDVIGESLANRSIQPGQELGQGFAVAPGQHGHAVIFIVGNSYGPTGRTTPMVISPYSISSAIFGKDKISTVELSPAVGFSRLPVRLRLARW